jgi:hypothetical protein
MKPVATITFVHVEQLANTVHGAGVIEESN